MQDLTLLTCSYETPEITVAMLRSFLAHHPGKHRLLVVENSRDEATRDLLRANGIRHLANPGGTHSPSVDLGLANIDTKHVLLIDTDIIFHDDVSPLYDQFRSEDLTLMGEVQESRGGYDLYSRVAPYCCFINRATLKKHGLRYHDQKRIESTGSQGFFSNLPLQDNDGRKHYDVGSTLLEDCLALGLKVGQVADTLPEYVEHFEGMSWREKSDIPHFQEWGKRVWQRFMACAKPYEDVVLSGRFE
ncbi:MAG: glycosyltransferase [Burkholderiales bacterium]|nr:glycosyltransferase [Burkholderiales bacterium]